MLITNNGLTIRSAQEKDAEILTKWWNDGKVMEHAGFPKGLGTVKEKTLELIKQNNVLTQRCVIEYDSLPVGEMSYFIKDDCAQIGIKICVQSLQNKGLGSKLLKMFIDFLFTDKKVNGIVSINKIILDTNKKNLRAQHVYEKLGFTKLRENINCWQDQMGELQSSVDYEMTRASWKALKKAKNMFVREKL